MNKMKLKVLVMMLVGFQAVLGVAQPAPDPADDIPEAMPFDLAFGTPINLERAEIAINAAIAESKKRNWKMNVAVVDVNGELISFKRMDNAQLASISIAEHKARAAARFRRETKLFEKGINIGKNNNIITLDGVIASRGGIPIVENGKIIGAIGCSGATGSQDELVCKAGVAAISK
jgi:uncharacterized protein GlcG (DUF336 family)